MAQPESHNRPTGDEASRQEEDPTATVDTAGLIPLLTRWQGADSLGQLRKELADYTQQLRSHQHTASHHEQESAGQPLRVDLLLAELEQIAASQTIERARYYIERLIKSISVVRTGAINDLNLNRWKEYEDIYTDSLWLLNRRDGSGVHTAGYWGNFIPQIPHQMMRRYTKRGEWVLDMFAGSGTTLIEGQRLGRNTIGVELQERMVHHAQQLVAAEPNSYGVTIDCVQGDSAAIDYKALLKRYNRESVQLVVMHPPYFDIIQFSNDARDLSNAATVDAFLQMMGTVVDNAAQVLDPGRYLVLVIGDKYAKGEWIPLGFQTMNEVMQRGFSLKSIIVKNFEDTSGKRTQKELWRYRALVGGFYIFKHEYIFLFRKSG